ncbi:MAG: hypothetical protein MRZ79_19820 [Bacteroidia bacterium]|nr:hypothetical protein [Bacteroidia bacterium]
MKLFNHLTTSILILCLALNFGCKQERCPDTQQTLDITPVGPLLVQGPGRSSSQIEIQYPTDCEGFAYRGSLTLEIEDQNAVPGGELFFEIDGQKQTSWTNGSQTPNSGMESIQIHLEPIMVNGSPSALTVGQYQTRLRANFDEPQDEDEVFLQIEVLAEGLSARIISPANGSLFDQNTDSVQVQARITDSFYGVNRLEFRVGRGENGNLVFGDWEGSTYPAQNEVNISKSVALGQFTDYKVLLRATNANGEIAMDSVEFTAETNNSPGTLTDLFWDGGGDGIHWHDPQNWDGDVVPNQSHRAIILSTARLDTVVITSTGSLQEVYPVGAIQIQTNVRIQNRAILQIENESQNSSILGALVFFQASNQIEDWAAIRFTNSRTFNNSDSILLNVNDLYLAGMRIEGDKKASVLVGDAIDDITLHDQVALAVLDGNVSCSIMDRATIKRSFVFEYANGGASLKNRGNWRLSGSMTLRQSGSGNPLFGVFGSSFFNYASVFVEGSGVDDAQLFVENPITFRNIDGMFNLLNRGSVTPADALFFSDSGGNRLGDFNCTGDVFLYYGSWSFDSDGFSQAKELHIGSQTLTEWPAPSLSVSGLTNNVNSFVINRGSLVVEAGTEIFTGLNRFKRIDVREEGRLLTSSSSGSPKKIEIDELSILLGEFGLRKEDTLDVKFLDWNRARILSFVRGNADMGSLSIGPDPQQRPSMLRLNNVFQHNLIVRSQAELQWLDGGTSTFDSTHTATLTINPSATFRVMTDQNLRWGDKISTNVSGQRLFIYNYGELIKQGNGEVEIEGCISNRGNGSLSVQGGSLNFEGNHNCN